MSTPQLFSPIKVGKQTLQHRVVLAPMARFRASHKEHVPPTITTTYYSQRAIRPGTLLITEATLIAPRAGGYYDGIPGIWSDAQIAAWKEITEAVHARGSFIFLQIGAVGRAAKPEMLAKDGFDHVAPSPIAISEEYATPRALTLTEIQEYIALFGQAAHNAVLGAGFDGIEVHCANGYLPDQFLQDVSNTRTDAYGGSIEKRSRFNLEVVDALVKAVGQERVAVRVSPWSRFQGMRMADPKPQFSYFVRSLRDRYSELAYLHATESDEPCDEDSNDFLREIWAPKPFISANNYTREMAIARTQSEDNALIAFGRNFISNPDLVTKLEKNMPLAPFHTETFYAGGETGYIDYPITMEMDA